MLIEDGTNILKKDTFLDGTLTTMYVVAIFIVNENIIKALLFGDFNTKKSLILATLNVSQL